MKAQARHRQQELDMTEKRHTIQWRCRRCGEHLLTLLILQISNDFYCWCSGWCFGTFFMTFHSVGNFIIPSEFHIFQRGWLKPPTRWLLTIINHIITINMNHILTVCSFVHFFHQGSSNSNSNATGATGWRRTKDEQIWWHKNRSSSRSLGCAAMIHPRNPSYTGLGASEVQISWKKSMIFPSQRVF